MASQKADDLIERGIALAALAEQTDDKRQIQDAASLLKLGLSKKAEGDADAEAVLANIYYQIGDFRAAKQYARLALQHDPLGIIAQITKVSIAYEEFKLGPINGGLFGVIASVSNWGTLKGETRKLIDIFQENCIRNVDANWFMLIGQRLIDLGDAFAGSFQIQDVRRQLYQAVSGVAGNEVTYDDEDQRREVEQLQAIAAGRAQP